MNYSESTSTEADCYLSPYKKGRQPEIVIGDPDTQTCKWLACMELCCVFWEHVRQRRVPCDKACVVATGITFCSGPRRRIPLSLGGMCIGRSIKIMLDLDASMYEFQPVPKFYATRTGGVGPCTRACCAQCSVGQDAFISACTSVSPSLFLGSLRIR
jgi:hypothetical protein